MNMNNIEEKFDDLQTILNHLRNLILRMIQF